MPSGGRLTATTRRGCSVSRSNLTINLRPPTILARGSAEMLFLISGGHEHLQAFAIELYFEGGQSGQRPTLIRPEVIIDVDGNFFEFDTNVSSFADGKSGGCEFSFYWFLQYCVGLI